MAINKANSSLQLLKMKRYLYIGNCFGCIDHNGVSQNYRKKQANNIIVFCAFVHTANGLKLHGALRHAALLFVHTLLHVTCGYFAYDNTVQYC